MLGHFLTIHTIVYILETLGDDINKPHTYKGDSVKPEYTGLRFYPERVFFSDSDLGISTIQKLLEKETPKKIKLINFGDNRKIQAIELVRGIRPSLKNDIRFSQERLHFVTLVGALERLV